MKRMFAVAILALLAGAGCSDGKGAQAREKLARARAYLEEAGDAPGAEAWKKARFLLQEALALAPDLVEARVLFARAWLVGGDYARALEEARRIPPGFGQNAVTRALASAALYRLRADPILAEDARVALVEAEGLITPEQRFEVGFDLVNCPREQGRGRAIGIQILQELIAAAKPPMARWQGVLGVALYMAGRKSEAAVHLGQALEDPTVPQAQTLRSLLETIE